MAKVKPKLDKTFTCLFCNHEKSVEVRVERETNIGTLTCRSCGVHWETYTHGTFGINFFSFIGDARSTERAHRRV